jgi:hypothetical protein
MEQSDETSTRRCKSLIGQSRSWPGWCGVRSVRKHPEAHRLVTIGNGLDTLVVLPAPKRCDLNEGVSTHGDVAAFFSKTGLARCREIKGEW